MKRDRMYVCKGTSLKPYDLRKINSTLFSRAVGKKPKLQIKRDRF